MSQNDERRNRQHSSEYSLSMEDAVQRNFQAEERLAKEMAEKCKGDSNEEKLSKMFSFRSAASGISTASTNAEYHQNAVLNPQPFREIGKGSCGQVFEHPGTTNCYKLTMLQTQDKLWNNYVQQSKVSKAFSNVAKRFPSLGDDVQVPKAQWWAGKDASFWIDNLTKFGFDPKTSDKFLHSALCMQRIFPLPGPMRNLIIDTFCHPRFQEGAKSDVKNKACLLRIMLGRDGNDGSALGFNLRNYSMTADKFEKLRLPATDYAEAMGHAMGVIHFEAQLDGEDIEFVLGSTPSEEQSLRHEFTSEDIEALPVGTSTFEIATSANCNFKKRIMCPWVLDFDACHKITLDEAGIALAVKAFFQTYAYCPRPHRTNPHRQSLWTAFGNSYLKTSKAILPQHQHGLPESFLKQVGDRVRSNRASESSTEPSIASSAASGSGRRFGTPDSSTAGRLSGFSGGSGQSWQRTPRESSDGSGPIGMARGRGGSGASGAGTSSGK